jgi:hypothetical protein
VFVLLGLLSCGGGASDLGPGEGETLRLTIVPREEWTGTVGRPIAPALAVKVEAEDGTARSGVEIAFAVQGGDAVLSSGHAVTDEAGVASVGLTLGKYAGEVTVTASGSGLRGSPVTFYLTADPDLPAVVAAVSGDSQTGFIGRPFHDTLKTRVTDQFGNPVPGTPVEWSVRSGGGSVTSVDPVTDRDGIVSAIWAAGAERGENELVASAGGSLSIDFAAKGVRTGGGRLLMTPWGPGPVQGVHLLNPDGTGFAPLPNAPGYGAMWSPDGSQIAFYDTPAIINADGTNPRRFSFGGTTEGFVGWSPDGTKLLVGSDSGLQFTGQMYIWKADGSGTLQVIPNTVGFLDGDWSPDGSKILLTFYEEGSEWVYVIAPDGTGKRRLAEGSGGRWSPDGKKIVFGGYAPGLGPRNFIMNADGTGQVIAPWPAGLGFVDWSPDGSRVLLMGPGDGLPGQVDEELYSVNPDGTDLVRITYDDIWFLKASWGP